MRNSHVAALVVAAIVATATFAGAQASTQRADRASRVENRAKGRGMDGRGARGGLFRDIKLSATEKSKVKEIHGKYRSEAKAMHESLKPAMTEARIARQKGDTAAARATLERTKGDRETLRALMAREKTEIRSALSAENQKQFDANVQQVVQRRADGAKQGKGRAGNYHRGVRPERSARVGTNG